mmetsp:Transcript_99668/g.197587  ORF Transcript_99668/g.197587 Transcript_99668/m.197587 type:complete len:98 (-) Transcript_99668:98-391(-)
MLHVPPVFCMHLGSLYCKFSPQRRVPSLSNRLFGSERRNAKQVKSKMAPVAVSAATARVHLRAGTTQASVAWELLLSLLVNKGSWTQAMASDPSMMI